MKHLMIMAISLMSLSAFAEAGCEFRGFPVATENGRITKGIMFGGASLKECIEMSADFLVQNPEVKGGEMTHSSLQSSNLKMIIKADDASKPTGPIKFE